jgi:hypothetical protein
MTRLAFFVLMTIQGAAQNASPPLDAKASDPVVMGWMVGSPPPANKIIRFSDSTFFRFPQTRWSFSNIRQLMPTRVVARGDTPAAPLSRVERKDLDGIRFHPLGSTDWMTWAQSLGAGRSRVLTKIIREGLQLTLAGVLAGTGSAVLLNRLIASLLFGVASTDATIFAMAIPTIALTAGVACSLPAWGASRLDPNMVLRSE